MKKYIFRFGIAFFTLAIGIIAGSVWVIHNHNHSPEFKSSSDSSPVVAFDPQVQISSIGQNSLPCAVKNGEIEKVRELLAAGVKVDSTADSCINSEPSPRGVTLLMKSAQRGDTEIVKLLLENGADVNASDSWQMSPLAYAIDDNHFEIINLLIESGANIDARGEMGRTILMSAAGGGDTKVIEYLLEKGMDINARDSHGTTALMFAAGFNKPEAIELLLARGANRNLKDNHGRTYLDYKKKGFPNEYFILKM